MLVYELIEILQQYASGFGGDNGSDEISIWHDGSCAELIAVDATDRDKQTVIMGDK